MIAELINIRLKNRHVQRECVREIRREKTALTSSNIMNSMSIDSYYARKSHFQSGFFGGVFLVSQITP